MCFVIQVNTQKASLAKYYGIKPNVDSDLKACIEKNSSKLKAYYHISGFDHPTLYGLDQNYNWSLKNWGLIPHWCNSGFDAKELQNKTLNARSETLKEKASYKQGIEQGRFVVFVDAYYEHHHINNQTFPYRFFREDGAQIALACVSDTWLDEDNKARSTFSIITTKGNEKAKMVHNNPKMKEARMPLSLFTGEAIEAFLKEGNMENVLRDLSDTCQSQNLKAQAVAKILGKGASQNSASSILKVDYPELGFFMPSEL